MFLLPVYVCHKRKFIGETLFTAFTGISSILYHGHELYGWNVHPGAIRNTDVILSFLLICHTMHCVAFYGYRWDTTIACLPFIIYACEVDIIYRLTGVIVYVICCLLCMLANSKRYQRRFMILGLFLGMNDVAFFILGNMSNYTILHGMHHLAVFSAQAIFMHGLCADASSTAVSRNAVLDPTTV